MDQMVIKYDMTMMGGMSVAGKPPIYAEQSSS